MLRVCIRASVHVHVCMCARAQRGEVVQKQLVRSPERFSVCAVCVCVCVCVCGCVCVLCVVCICARSCAAAVVQKQLTLFTAQLGEVVQKQLALDRQTCPLPPADSIFSEEARAPRTP